MGLASMLKLSADFNHILIYIHSLFYQIVSIYCILYLGN